MEQCWTCRNERRIRGHQVLLAEQKLQPVLSYVGSRWPPQPTIATELDRIQSKMVASMLRIKRQDGEGAADYCRRRNRDAAFKCRQLGRWSSHWFERVLKWDAHLERAHCHQSWAVLLRSFHDEIWLETHRFETNSHGTATRTSRGRPLTRWHEGVSFAKGHL